MRDWKVERCGVYKGRPWIIKLMLPEGYRCGYVEAPKALNKLKRELEDLDVHGGVTFLERFNPLTYETASGYWAGFDCHHFGDGIGCPPEDFEGLFQGEIRSLEYCVKECEKLIDQLIELEERVAKED